ncbi:MAG: hypothetical protein ACOCQ4_02980 [bacterium]
MEKEKYVLKFQKFKTNEKFIKEFFDSKSVLNFIKEARQNNIFLHSDDGPAWSFYNQYGVNSHSAFFTNGQKTKEIDYDPFNQKIQTVTYFKNNKIHRDNAPAKINFYDNGSIKSEVYIQNGKVHREDGPAVMDYPELSLSIPRAVSQEYWKNKEYWENDAPHGDCLDRNWDNGSLTVYKFKHGLCVDEHNQKIDPKTYIEGKILQLYTLAEKHDLNIHELYNGLMKKIDNEVEAENKDTGPNCR